MFNVTISFLYLYVNIEKQLFYGLDLLLVHFEMLLRHCLILLSGDGWIIAKIVVKLMFKPNKRA